MITSKEELYQVLSGDIFREQHLKRIETNFALYGYRNTNDMYLGSIIPNFFNCFNGHDTIYVVNNSKIAIEFNYYGVLSSFKEESEETLLRLPSFKETNVLERVIGIKDLKDMLLKEIKPVEGVIS